MGPNLRLEALRGKNKNQGRRRWPRRQGEESPLRDGA